MNEVIQKLNKTEPDNSERFNALSFRFTKYRLDLMSSIGSVIFSNNIEILVNTTIIVYISLF